MHHFFEHTAATRPYRVAVEDGEESCSYRRLDALADLFADYLRGLGVRPGARVALVLHRCAHTYAALLGVLKAGAAFVPVDPGAPADRVAFVVEDAGVAAVVVDARTVVLAADLHVPVVRLDADEWRTASFDADGEPPGRDAEPDPVAYVIYTSGSSGRPKGVEITHRSIANFLSVVPRIYDVRPEDRVYQGMTLAFDFSIEEVWPTLAVGATLVVGPDDHRRLGPDLADFLEERAVSVLYCVPTLLATLPRDLPMLRSVLVGGEACPRELVERWARPGRRMLNTYGPTEATVTATWSELREGRPVTIGRPLPTYAVVLLDEELQEVPPGEVGEIAIGGPGVARGYVGLPEKTADRFRDVPGHGRLYRTGDLGRVTVDGEIEYLGRADDEVKVRGHRVDLGEIESVVLEEPGVAAAVVALRPTGALAGYIVPAPDQDAAGEFADRALARCRRRLPNYMVPATIDVLASLPTMPSGKVDRRLLPAPVARRPTVVAGDRAPSDELEVRVRDAWAEILGLPAEEIPVDADLFTDLGGHSLVAAELVSRLRLERWGREPGLRDLYAHPTVRRLAANLGPATAPTSPEAPPAPAALASSARVAGVGGAQAVLIYLLLLATTVPATWVYVVNDGEVSVRVLAQLILAVLVSWFGVRWLLPLLLVVPVAAGIRPGSHPLWGVTHMRLWTVDLLLGLGVLRLLAGSPFAGPYLRVLGAHVGPDTTIATEDIALPSLVEIAPGASIGYGVTLRPWQVVAGRVVVDRICVGAGAVVGAGSVLAPGAKVRTGAVLGEQSSLGPGEEAPPCERRRGSPPTTVETADAVTEAMLTRPRPGGWRPRHLAAAAVGVVGLEITSVATLLPAVALVWWALLTWGVLAGLVAALAAGPVYVVTVCVLVALGKRLVLRRCPIGIHPVRSSLGIRKWISDKLLQLSLDTTNSLYATLYTSPWLRLLGARIGPGAEVSTVAHVDPELVDLGAQSFVADMAAVGPARFAGGYMALVPTRVGRRAFVGNAAVIPSGSVVGEGSLVGCATVPESAEVPAGTSWLGSPAIRLPRRQDSGDFPEELTFRPPRAVLRRRLAIEFVRATLPAGLLALGVYLYLWFLSMLAFGRDLLVPALAAPLVAIGCAAGVIGVCAAAKWHLVGAYRPRVEPLWSDWVRRSEFVTGLYESAAVPVGMSLLTGTPFLPAVLRWFGVRVGRRAWIATTYLTEFDLVSIGDDAAVGHGVSLQTHLFEDRVMKVSAVEIGAAASVGARSIVLYDGVVEPGAVLESLSLVMKGEALAHGRWWRGIPAESTEGADRDRATRTRSAS